MENPERKTASLLLEIEAVKINPNEPFTWASGIKSPIYCDNRMTLSFPEVRTYIKDQLALSIQRAFPEVEVIAGVATAGIPQGSLIADQLNLPFIYVRSKPKDHGMKNMIEGKVERGQKVVVIEDLISTAGSSLKAVHALREAECEVLGMAAIFTYGFKEAEENLEHAGVKAITLTNYEELLQEAVNENYIKQSDLVTLWKWKENPASWWKKS